MLACWRHQANLLSANLTPSGRDQRRVGNEGVSMPDAMPGDEAELSTLTFPQMVLISGIGGLLLMVAASVVDDSAARITGASSGQIRKPPTSRLNDGKAKRS